MTAPTPSRIFQALDATWPAARMIPTGPWTLRQGLGGGQRVSAATALDDVREDDIATAEQGMRAIDQRPLFMVRGENDRLDRWLEARSYDIVDPVTIYVAKSSDLVGDIPISDATSSWPPLAVQREIWASGGIDDARIAVMTRVQNAKTTILGRQGDTPGGTGFVASDGPVAMLHALEVSPDQRRKGIGAKILTAAANWAVAQKAPWLALAVTSANTAANALYLQAGMTKGAQYHYRRAPEAAS